MPISYSKSTLLLTVGILSISANLAGQSVVRPYTRIAARPMRASGHADSPEWISAPVVGLMTNSGQTQVRAIYGVAGASTLGLPIPLADGVARIRLAPGQRWALVEQADGAPLGLLRFQGAAPGNVQSIDGALAAPDLVGFSPAGRSAVLFSRAGGTLQVLAGLDSTPRVAFEVQLSYLATARQVAVNDDGTFPLILSEDGNLYAVPGAVSPQLLFRVGGPAGVTFLPGLASAVVADSDGGTVTLIENLRTAPATRIVATGLQFSADEVFVQASGDAGSVFVAASGAKSASRIDLATGDVQALDLPVGSSRLERLRNGDIFLFSAEPGESAWLLAGDRPGLRALFVVGPADEQTEKAAPPPAGAIFQ